MRKIKLILFTFFYILLLVNSYAQKNSIDSIKQIISISKLDTNKVKNLLVLGDQYENSSYDTALYYYGEALKDAKKINAKKQIADSYNYIGIIHYKQCDYDEAIKFFNKSLEYCKELDYKKVMADNYGNIGIVFSDKGRYENAIKYFQKAIEISEEIDAKKNIATNYVNIGIVYSNMKDYKKSLEFYEKAISFFKEENNKFNIAVIYINMGTSYSELNKYDEAISLYEKSLIIFEELNSKIGIATNLLNIGIIYNKQKKYEKALQTDLKALKIFKGIDSKISIAQNLTSISDVYYNMNRYYVAINYAKKALKVSKQIGSLKTERDALNSLSQAYKGIGNYKKAIEYKDLWIEINDSLFTVEKAKSIEEISISYQTEKKEKLILQQQSKIDKDRLLAEKEKSEKFKQSIIRNVLIISFIVLLIFLLILYKNFRQKTFANYKIIEINKELKTSLETLNEQNNKISVMYKDITDNLNTAKIIQQALLPSHKVLNTIFEEYFIIYKPKNIIGGDFYFAEGINENVIFGVADSTGHGVSGAIGSILGIAFLNNIISRNIDIPPKKILSLLKIKIIETFKTYGTENNNGLDMAYCKYDKKTKKLIYSGAFIPLWVIKDGNLQEYKPTRNTIANSCYTADFKDIKVELDKGDIIYLFTDGYADQMNNNKKFKIKKFRDLIKNIKDLDLYEQKEQLLLNLNKWKGNTEQTDDITIFCIKV